MVPFGFFALTVVMIFAPVLLILKFSTIESNDRAFLLKRYFIGILVWFTYILLMSSLGLLDGFELPPKIGVFVILPAFFCIFLFQRVLTPYLKQFSLHYGIYIQSFRILVELLIFGGFVIGLYPELLTFKGHNMDILVGISAPIIAFLHQKFNLSNKVLLIWNIAGILTLFHTIATFTRSFYFLNHFTEEAAMQFLRVPYVLLPALLAPMAIFFHILSIRQILAIKK